MSSSVSQVFSTYCIGVKGMELSKVGGGLYLRDLSDGRTDRLYSGTLERDTVCPVSP